MAQQVKRTEGAVTVPVSLTGKMGTIRTITREGVANDSGYNRCGFADRSLTEPAREGYSEGNHAD